MPVGQVFSGPRCRFLIGSDVVAYASGVSHEESYDYTPIEVLNHLEVMEHVVTAYRCSLSAAFFRLVGSSLKAYNATPSNLPLQVFPILENALVAGTLSAVMEDVVTGTTPAMFIGVRAAHKTADVTARGVVSENVSFVAIRVKDENGF